MKEIRLLAKNTLQNNGRYYLQLVSNRPLSSFQHSHDFYEITCVLSASCLQIVNQKERRCTVGNVTILKPSDTHCFKSQEDDLYLIVFSVEAKEFQRFMETYEIDHENLNTNFFLSPDNVVHLKKLCSKWVLMPSDYHIYKIIMGIVFSSMLEAKTNFIKKMPDDFKKVVIEMNKFENAVEGISAFLRLSKYSHAQLCRLTKKWLNLSPKEYVNSIRLKYAYEMIAYENKSFENIAGEVGFSSVSHFVRLIKQKFGVPPTIIRNRVQENKNLVN